MVARYGTLDEDYNQTFFKKLISVHRLLSEDQRLLDLVEKNCEELGSHSPFGFASLYSNKELGDLSLENKVKAFQAVCKNVNYFKKGEDSEKGHWEQTQTMQDHTPVIKSARGFTDYCTTLRMREKITARLEGLMKETGVTFNQEKADEFMAGVVKGCQDTYLFPVDKSPLPSSPVACRLKEDEIKRALAFVEGKFKTFVFYKDDEVEEMEVEAVNVHVKPAKEVEEHAKEAVSGEKVAESQHEEPSGDSADAQLKAWLEGGNGAEGGQQPSNEDTAQQAHVAFDVRDAFKPASIAEDFTLLAEAKHAADEHEAAKKTVKKLNKAINNYVSENLQAMGLKDETGDAVRAELKRRRDELEVLTTDRKKKKERRLSLQATLESVTQKLEMGGTPEKESGLPELPPILAPIPEAPTSESRHATPAPKQSPEVPNQPGFFYGSPWDPVKCYEALSGDDKNLNFKTEKKLTKRDGSTWDARKAGIKEIEFLEFLVANPLEGKPIGYSRSDIYVSCQEKVSKALHHVYYKATVVAIGAEQTKCWVFQSEILTYAGVPAVTLACCDAVKATKQLLSVFFEGVGVAAVITDVPWGSSEKAGYPTDIDWKVATKAIFGSVADNNGSMDKYEKAVDLGGPDGDTVFTVMGTLEVLQEIERESKNCNLTGFVNLPGCITFSQLRLAEVRSNTPCSSGIWYTCLARTPSKLVMDWKAFFTPQVSERHKYILARKYKYDVLSTSFTGNILTCPSNEEKASLLRQLMSSVKESIREERGEDVAPGDDDEKKDPNMLNMLVQRYTYLPGQLVMDPFMGTGSTGVGALHARRAFFGMEIQQETFCQAMMMISSSLAGISL
ncbi:hypothetical protein CYMTET_8702 [Cymbomonas tetramitiformis]|uniref:DNA methylase N-4/N-6 domain-containing protein n=1 Tax=Cymbomonas tetramitiformis TaxID=36881 RepID=A0AAE0GSH6_9CHLO|nr:hypothetical protein CYMTET_8702 [Cymbomonas tetramitiformis]